MKRVNVLHLLLELLVIFGNLVLGVTVLTYMTQSPLDRLLDRIFIGVIVLALGIFEFTDFFSLKYVTKMRSIQSLVAAILQIALGLLFMIVKIDSKVICILWGSVCIVASILIIITAGLNMTHQPLLNIIRIILRIIEIVFCILLLVRSLDFIDAYLIFTGVALIIEAVTLLIEFIIHRYQR